MSIRESDLFLQSRRAVQRGHDLPPAKISLRGEDEAERARRSRREYQKSVKVKKRKQRKQVQRRPSTLAAPLAMSNDNQVLTFHEWCQLNRISERTGRRILKSGSGPKVVQLSEKRIGITIGANRSWQEQQARG